jgi:hypothetical protein
MSERSYFSLRYAIPGYTFMLLVIGLNYSPISASLSDNSTFSTFLGLVSLAGGSALGFLISQLWWRTFQRSGGIFGIHELRMSMDLLIARYGLIDPRVEEHQHEAMRLTAIFDYLSFSERVYETKNEIMRISTRRWDMYHLLSSTFYTLVSGLRILLLVH